MMGFFAAIQLLYTIAGVPQPCTAVMRAPRVLGHTGQPVCISQWTNAQCAKRAPRHVAASDSAATLAPPLHRHTGEPFGRLYEGQSGHAGYVLTQAEEDSIPGAMTYPRIRKDRPGLPGK